MIRHVVLLCAILLLAIVPVSGEMNIVATVTVLSEPLQYIGGERVHAISVADPSICPHVQSDIIPNRIQMEKDFITAADLFVAINGSVDRENVMPFCEKFVEANELGTVSWITLQNPSMVWNTPDGAKTLSREVAGWLIAADPANRSYYEERLGQYLAQIDAADLSAGERQTIGGQDVIVMLWQREAAEQWLGLNVVTVFAPEFYQNGQNTPRAVVNDIYNNPEKYRNVKYVIENMQSEEMAQGIEEALHDHGIPAQRVVFTNFPRSVPGVDSLPDVLEYNKGLVDPAQASPAGQPSPLGVEPVAFGIAIACVALVLRRRG